MGSSRGGKVEGGRGRRGVHEGRSKCSKGRREARVVRLDGTGGSQRVKRQREGDSERVGTGGRGGMEGEKKRYTRQRAKKEKRLLPCSLRRSPSAMTVFMLPSFARLRYTGCSGRKRREERRREREREESREDVEGERGERKTAKFSGSSG